MAKVPVNLRLDIDLVDWIDERAKINNRSRTEQITKMLVYAKESFEQGERRGVSVS